MKPLIALRVLSGPALGAVIELPAGRYSVGTDDSCDVVLVADSTVAARHLALEIRQSAAGVEVVAAPLEDGRVVLNGGELAPAGAAVPPGEALGLGFTALAWRPVGEAWEPITLVTLEFAQALLQTRTPEDKVTDAGPESPLAVAASEHADEPVTAEVDTGGKTPERGGHRRSLVLFALVLSVVVLALVALTYAKTDDARAAQVQALAGELERAGIKTVVVLEAEDPHALLLRGVVADDSALKALVQIASAQPLRTYLDVRVGDDLLRVLRETLNAHDFYPEVSYTDGDRLHLALYLKDALTENRLLELGQDVPRLAQATRKLAYAQDVAPLLGPELRALGLDDTRVAYLPGKVVLPYPLTPDAMEQLAAALDRVRQRLGVPIVFQVDAGRAGAGAAPGFVPVLTTNATATMKGDPAPAAEVKNAALGSLTVMSVTSGVIPFVTMSDQQKFFPGAVLPNGVSLVSIHPDRLVLQKDQEIFTYSLKETP
ncbi:hypothetical protein FACS1894116_05870 [Betaproteobacteria bacterium]|nr:hypothetical protein FACS1894116_05870 [Betaproteobacteria bacterium]GHT98303.1 hypothetical protein FACS1894154_03380 [Betaproteobacteria bacterium]GHU23390.1 hypothetical protein FACS189488_05850 [Betaproteobacteria bacterium]